MRYQYNVVEVSDVGWKAIMDSDDQDVAMQHLNHWGKEGWEMVCVVPRVENGTTMGYGIVFKRELGE